MGDAEPPQFGSLEEELEYWKAQAEKHRQSEHAANDRLNMEANLQRKMREVAEPMLFVKARNNILPPVLRPVSHPDIPMND